MNVRLNALAYVLALFMTGAAGGAQAMVETASGTFDFINETSMNYGFLFIDDPDQLHVLSVGFGAGMSGWVVEFAGPAYTVLAGPAIAPGGFAQLMFEYGTPQVSLQWAEVLFDGVAPQIHRSGTATFNAGQGWSGNGVLSLVNRQTIIDYFPAAVTSVPAPASVFLMLSGLALLGTSAIGRHELSRVPCQRGSARR